MQIWLALRYYNSWWLFHTVTYVTLRAHRRKRSIQSEILKICHCFAHTQCVIIPYEFVLITVFLNCSQKRKMHMYHVSGTIWAPDCLNHPYADQLFNGLFRLPIQKTSNLRVTRSNNTESVCTSWIFVSTIQQHENRCFFWNMLTNIQFSGFDYQLYR